MPGLFSRWVPGFAHKLGGMTSFSQHPAAERVIVHISDTHLLAQGEKLFGVIDARPPLQLLLERLAESGTSIDALVFTGDLADRGEEDAYRELRGLVEPWAATLGAELIWVMGNHDDREAYSQILMDTSPTQQPQDAVYDLAGLRVIALDTSVPGYHHGELTSDQKEWLRAELATPAPHGTLLAMHHPPIPTPIELMGLIELEDQAALAAVIAGSDVRGVLAGHLHYSTFSTFAGVPVSVAAAACYNIDLVGPKTTLLSAKTTGSAASLVHVYPEQVVFSEVPLDDVAEIMSYDAGYLATIEAMSPEERRAMFSKKDSDFNRADDQAHSGS